ncbi:GbsR/MarR family transcriptional regulator [Sinosporangium siamense]|uniref:Transcriptional regulator n=1 Tax=Sinosporangium siamense TaxID=1367973 RepID=A0A919V8J3_9ACTN|nr:MarR family transcriptional regulator [Sinosporangium siamense]GII96195.1 transcriptional regulator [Sinosporangium siamense]
MTTDEQRFRESFAVIMAGAGYPRMAARVFSAILLSESGRLTSGELAGVLDAGPSAISPAVRYLTQVGMVIRERAPGQRRDHYRIHESAWYGAMGPANEVFRRLEEGAREGVEVFGAGTPIGARLEEIRSFFAYLGAEVPRLLRSWSEARAGLGP